MLELLKVEDPGGAYIIVTLKMPRKLVGYLSSILDQLLGISRQMHWKARCATAERRAFQQIRQIPGNPQETTAIRNEMILFLTEEGWTAEQIAEVYNLTPNNVRQIRGRMRRKS
jgi:DNA-binding NarL/FixJ family response regulator